MKESNGGKRPQKRSAPGRAAKPKSGRKPPAPTFVRTKRRAVTSVKHTKNSNVSVDDRDLWEPLEATLKIATSVAKSIWEWLRENVMLIVDFTARTVRRVQWSPL